MTAPIISLTTDFGPGPFAGLMKAVVLGICPGARLVDLSHAVPPQDVRAGAYVLETALGVFPAGSIHLGVVDPGVGTIRRGMVMAAAGQLWVGPDNGLFTAALEADPSARCWELAEARFQRRPLSRTFHGRDLFAPAAAHLAAGARPEEMGPPVADPVRLEWPQPREETGRLLGAVLGADAFGNLFTNLDRTRVEGFLAGRPARVQVPGLEVAGILGAYAQAPAGAALALFNSLDRLELAQNGGNLLDRLGWERGRVFGRPVTVLPAA